MQQQSEQKMHFFLSLLLHQTQNAGRIMCLLKLVCRNMCVQAGQPHTHFAKHALHSVLCS